MSVVIETSCEVVACRDPVTIMSSTTLTMFETCCTMDRWQQIGYFTYKAKLRQDINDDWIDINHDIWVSFVFHFSFRVFVSSIPFLVPSPSPRVLLSFKLVFRLHVLPGSGFSIFHTPSDWFLSFFMFCFL